MGQKLKKHYTAFGRTILSEFMTKKELDELDKKYNNAKLLRFVRKINNFIKK